MTSSFEGDPIALGSAQLLDLPSDFERSGNGLLVNGRLMTAARQMGAGSLLLVRDEFEAVDEAGLSGAFIEDVELGLSREQSRHVAYYGQTMLKSATDHERPELVAMKPYYDNELPEVIHEFVVNRHINQIDSRQRAFRPLGLWKDVEGGYTLITRYDHSVLSFDNIFWADKTQDHRALEPGVVSKALRMSTFGIGLIHGDGLTHGDAQAKNLGSDSKMIRFIDLEEARQFPKRDDGHTPDEEQTREAVERDLSTFLNSCFQNPDNTDEIVEAIADTVDSMARSYHQGVRRTVHKRGPSRYPRKAKPTYKDLKTVINKAVNEAIEADH